MLARGMYGGDYVIIGTDGSTAITPEMIRAEPDSAGLFAVIDGMLGVQVRPQGKADFCCSKTVPFFL